MRGAPIGTEQVSLLRSAEGWTISSNGRLSAPIDAVARRVEARYTSDWRPREFTFDGNVRGTAQTLHVVVDGNQARTDMTIGGQPTQRTDPIDPNAVLILPNTFFGTFEAIAARIKSTAPGSDIPAYGVPGVSFSVRVGSSTPQQIQTTARVIAATRTQLTLAFPGSAVPADIWTDEAGRMIRLSVPGQALEVVREDVASVASRSIAISRPNDEPFKVAANGFVLAATLSRPPTASATRLPAVVLVGSTGPTDRDHLVYGIPILGELAGALADAGFIVVRYDKRGVGQSGGRAESAALADYAEDVRAVVKALTDRKDVDPKRIAVVGYSAGGSVALLAASKDKRVHAVALLATPGVTGAELILEQQRHSLDRSTMSAQEKQAAVDLQRRIHDAVITGKGWEQLPTSVRRAADNPEFHAILTNDPSRIIPEVRQPILIVQGTLDTQVDPSNADRLLELAKGRKNAPPCGDRKNSWRQSSARGGHNRRRKRVRVAARQTREQGRCPGADRVAAEDALDRALAFARTYIATRHARPVWPTTSLADLRAALGGPLPDDRVDAGIVIDQLIDAADPGTVSTTGPRYFGFVTGGALPATVAAEWLNAVWDQNAGLYVMSPAMAVVEEVAAGWLLDVLQLPAQASVGFVTGCHMANFTALAAARHELLRRVGWDVEHDGLQRAPRLRVIVGDEAHVSVLGSLRYLGFGAREVVRVAADEQGRMRPDALEHALAQSSDPTIVCAQAGNVNTGAFDPFDAIAVAAHAHGAWLHIDGAFGLWASASPTLRTHTHGAGQADSWATDAHKWLNVPYDSGLVFTAHPSAHQAAMSTAAAYLVRSSEEPRECFDWVPESSRRARGLAIYAALRSLGRRGVADLIDRCARLARHFAECLREEPRLQILNDVVLNQVLVRVNAGASGDADALTRAALKRVQDERVCWLGGTTWHGMDAMRISVSNWSTTESDVEQSADSIIRSVRALA